MIIHRRMTLEGCGRGGKRMEIYEHLERRQLKMHVVAEEPRTDEPRAMGGQTADESGTFSR